MDFKQPIGDVNLVIRVDADQVAVEGRMVDFGQRQAIRGRSAVLIARLRP
jgi:hypothetical protein